MDLTKVPVAQPQVAARVVDGSAVIVLADSGEVTVLNPVGTRVWELIDGRSSLREIAAALQAEFEVGRQQAEKDVFEFAQALAEAGAIDLVDGPAPK